MSQVAVPDALEPEDVMKALAAGVEYAVTLVHRESDDDRGDDLVRDGDRGVDALSALLNGCSAWTATDKG